MPLEDNSVNAVICSPPFFGAGEQRYGGDKGIGDERNYSKYIDSIYSVVDEMKRVCDGPIWMCIGIVRQTWIDEVDAFQIVDFPIKEGRFVHGGAWCRFSESGYLDKDVFKRKSFFHYPDYLIEKMILELTNVGDIVLDPFAGTGTTCKVANKLNRLGVCCDIVYGDQHLNKNIFNR